MAMHVVTERFWNNSEVTAYCDDDRIGAEMELSAFLSVLFHAAGIKDDALAKKLYDTAPEVLALMKKTTARVAK